MLCIAAADLVLREVYHRLSLSAAGLKFLGVAAVVLVCAAFLVERLLASRWQRAADRLLFCMATTVSAYWVLGSVASAWWQRQPQGLWLSAAAWLLAAGLVVRTNLVLWAKLRLVTVVVTGLFVVSQIGLGALSAKDHIWPMGLQAQDAAADAGRVATVVLLLDELNARSSGPIVEELRQLGLQVRFKPVPSIGDSTAKVVPALFTGTLFDEPRPCGFTTICSGQEALDFRRIQASRPDIDVVGFYHPYCAIQGLRSCTRVAADMGFFEANRWKCGLWRRFGWPGQQDPSFCQQVAMGAWVAMRERSLQELRNVRTLKHGGVLFAHLPLPHPPGKPGDGSLAEHYTANVKRSAAVLGELVQTARAAGLALRVVIFSDHPLRQQMWCASTPMVYSEPCLQVEALSDDQVPLIVAGAAPPDLTPYTSNLDAFSLVSSWANR